MLDPTPFIGPYAFRHVPHPDPEVLVRVMERERIESAWVGHLPSVFHRDPRHGNRELACCLQPFRGVLAPAPVVRPDWPDWRAELQWAAEADARAVRAYPQVWGLGPDDARLPELAAACAERNLALLLTVKFEDLRQRHPLDVAGDLPAATVRAIARAHTGVRLLVCAAGRDVIEEVHWGLTPEERRQVWWDISWIWGPPEDHLALLLETIGADRFVFGTSWPLRLTQVARANLALLPEGLRGVQLADPDSWRSKAE
jgi:hypothetical protein